MVKKHDNVVILKGDIKSVKYISGSTIATKGQPFDDFPKIKVKEGVATIVFSSGRKKSKEVAEVFNNLSKSKYASQGGSGGSPKELNFMFSIDVDGSIIHLGQGSNGPRNNWWVGHDGLKVTGTSMRTAIGKAYDKLGEDIPEPFNHVHAFLGKLFSKDLFNAVNMFEIKQ